MDQAENNVETFSEGKYLTGQEQKVLNQALEQFRSQVIVPCTACHYCDGCPMELEIPDILKLYNRYSLSKSPRSYGRGGAGPWPGRLHRLRRL